MNVISRGLLSAAAAVLGCVVATLPAAAGPSERMKTACTSDYLNFCSQYDPDSFQTINCMKKNQNKISKACRQVVQEEGIPSAGGSGRTQSSSRSRFRAQSNSQSHKPRPIPMPIRSGRTQR